MKPTIEVPVGLFADLKMASIVAAKSCHRENLPFEWIEEATVEAEKLMEEHKNNHDEYPSQELIEFWAIRKYVEYSNPPSDYWDKAWSFLTEDGKNIYRKRAKIMLIAEKNKRKDIIKWREYINGAITDNHSVITDEMIDTRPERPCTCKEPDIIPPNTMCFKCSRWAAEK